MTSSTQAARSLAAVLVAWVTAAVLVSVVALGPSHSFVVTGGFKVLYAAEQSAAGRYRWTPPQFSAVLPLPRLAQFAIVRQRLVAGPSPTDTRTLSVTTAGHVLSFDVAGLQVRNYDFLAPSSGSDLRLNYRIAALATKDAQDPRPLGVALFGTTVTLPETAYLPSSGALSIMALFPLAILALVAWGLPRVSWMFGAALAAAALLAYAFAPAQTLAVCVPIPAALLVLAGGGWLCRHLALAMSAVPRDAGHLLVIAWAAASVLVPLAFAAVGLSDRLWQEWPLLPALFWSTLLAPLFASGLYLATLALGSYPPRRMAQVTVALALAGALAWNVVHFARAGWDQYPTDFKVYHDAIVRFNTGHPIYDLQALASNPFGSHFKYHRVFLFPLLPLAHYRLEDAADIWRGGTVLAFATSAGLIVAARPRRERLPLGLVAALLCVGFAPLKQTVRLGQADALFLLTIVAGLVAASRRATGPYTLGWGVLGLIKCYHLIMLLPAVLAKQWQRLVGVVLTGAAVVAFTALVFGAAEEIIFWREVVPLLGGQRSGWIANQSPYAALARALEPMVVYSSYQLHSVWLLDLLFFALVAGFLTISALVLWRRRETLVRCEWEATSLMVVTLLLGVPVSWDHYQTLLLLPLLVAAGHSLRRPQQAPLLLLAYTLLAFGTAKQLRLDAASIPNAFMLTFVSYRLLGLLLLWGWWLRWWMVEAEHSTRKD